MIWPQLILLSLTLIGIGVAIAKHKEPREPYNAWTIMAATAVQLWLLYMGGFFDCLLK